MLNYIWIGLILISIVVAAINGKMAEVGNAAIEYAKLSVDISLGLIGIMALWLGIMRIGETAGLVQALSRLLQPILRYIFPDIPRDHPATGAIMMNISANMLGLNNAATPLGLKAMEELQKLNQVKERATNAMVMFLTVNTSSVQLIPATAIAILVAAGSQSPTDIIITALLATSVSTISGILAVKAIEMIEKVRSRGHS